MHYVKGGTSTADVFYKIPTQDIISGKILISFKIKMVAFLHRRIAPNEVN